MWIVIDGLAGSGKSWLTARLIRAEWKRGARVYTNFGLKFSPDNEDIQRWHSLDEIYNISRGIVAIDDVQKLVGHWLSMPAIFRDKVAEHRRHLLDFVTNTQDFTNIHRQIRINVHELYRCETIMRFPRSDRVFPILQIIRVVRKTRQISDNDQIIKFKKVGYARFHFISRFWTRDFHNTYADTINSRYICKLIYEKKATSKRGQWLGKIYSRDLVNRGKARI